MDKTLVVRRALGVLALAGFLVSLAVHLEALRGVDVQGAFPICDAPSYGGLSCLRAVRPDEPE